MAKITTKMGEMSREDLLELVTTRTNAEAARHLSVDERTVSRWRKRLGLSNLKVRHADCPMVLDDSRLEVVTGTMLGDASLYMGRLAANAQYRFKQSENHSEYVTAIRSALGPYVKCEVTTEKNRCPSRDANGVISMAEDLWDGRFVYAERFQSISHPVFTALRRKWYPAGTKVVPRDIRLNWRVAAFWHCDDGSNNQARTNVTLHTNGFSKADVEFLIERLREDLGVASHIEWRREQPVVYIGKDSYFDFLAGVRPHIPWKCFAHKVDVSEVRETRPGWGPGKLDMEKAREIRRLYWAEEYTQYQLAALFGVSQSMIGRIVNNKAFREDPVGTLSGSAEVTLLVHDNEAVPEVAGRAAHPHP